MKAERKSGVGWRDCSGQRPNKPKKTPKQIESLKTDIKGTVLGRKTILQSLFTLLHGDGKSGETRKISGSARDEL